VSSCPTDDYGNSFDTATKVSPNSTVRGVVNCETDYDFFGVELTKAGTLNISIANTSAYAWFYRTKDYNNAQRFNYPGSSFNLPTGIYHFAVSGHANKPYTITLSCDDCMGVPAPIKVTSVTPTEAKFKQKTTFTIAGTNLPDTLAAWIDECANPKGESLPLEVNHISKTKQTFECIPSHTKGQKRYEIKNKSQGKILKKGLVNVVDNSTPPTSPTINIKSTADKGEKITFSVKLGKDLDNHKIKASCHSEGQTFESIYKSGGETVTFTNLVFNSIGEKRVFCTNTSDIGLTSSEVYKVLTIKEKSVETFKLSVSVQGNGSIISSPTGINCGSDCSEDYKKGTTITLTATPKSGYIFDSWSDACAGNGDCEILNIDSDKTVKASFKLNKSTDFKITSILPKEVVINQKNPTIFEIKGENLPENLKIFIPECEKLEILVKSKVQYFVQCTPKHTRGIKRPIIKTNEGIVISHNLLLEFYLKVAIDAGHGQICTGNKPSLNKKGDCLDGTWQFHRGEYTYTGDDTDPSNDVSVREDELTLNIALRVKNLLISEPFIKVYLTRDTNHSPYPGVISNKDSSSNIRKLDTAWRRDLIIRESPSLSFSIHTNGGTDLSYGTETWYRPFKKLSNQSVIDKPFAISSHAKMTSLGLRDRKIKNNSWKSNIQNIGEIPNFLVEVAFHSNTKRNVDVGKTDIEILSDSVFLYNVSNKLYNLVIETADIKND